MENGCLFSQLPGLILSFTTVQLYCDIPKANHFVTGSEQPWVGLQPMCLQTIGKADFIFDSTLSFQVLEGAHALALPETFLKGWAKARAEGARVSSQHRNCQSQHEFHLFLGGENLVVIILASARDSFLSCFCLWVYRGKVRGKKKGPWPSLPFQAPPQSAQTNVLYLCACHMDTTSRKVFYCPILPVMWLPSRFA